MRMMVAGDTGMISQDWVLFDEWRRGEHGYKIGVKVKVA